MAWRHAWMVGSALAATVLVPATAMAERVVFLNTEPLMVNNMNGQDPTLDSYNTTGFTPGPISGWPGLTEQQQTQLLYHLKEASVPFDIIWTFERPVMGSYDMIVMGTDEDNAILFPGLGCSAAIGLADCGDANAENISFLFYGCMSAGDQMDMHRVAFRIFSALGFGWGLENLTGTGQIMAGYTATGLEVGDVCTDISGMELCPGEHVGCPAGQQNSTADLLQRLGARIDDGPPFVTITAPEDDMVVNPDIQVTAAVGDLFGGLTVELEVVEAMQSLVDQTPPYSWSLTGIPQGTWTLRVNAIDADDNMVSEEISVCVDLPACGEEPGEDSTGTAGGESTGSGDEFTTDVFEPDTSTTSGSSSGGIPQPDPTTGAPVNPTSFGGDTPDTGCQCRADARGDGGPAGLLGLLLLLGVFTRRE